MKWKTRHPKRAEVGDTRTRETFAWLPVTSENGFTYWMTKVIVHERLMRRLKRKRGGFAEEEERWVAFRTELPGDKR